MASVTSRDRAAIPLLVPEYHRDFKGTGQLFAVWSASLGELSAAGLALGVWNSPSAPESAATKSPPRDVHTRFDPTEGHLSMSP